MLKKRAGAQVTVFISLIMMCVFSFFCVLLESARTAGARWYLQTAACSAMDSVFSQYHRQLWDSYRLLFSEYETEEELEADFSEFLRPYLETGNWYPMELASVSAGEISRATDEQGLYFEREILDYMKYGVWKMDFDADTAGKLWEDAREAAAVKDVSELYRGRSREALKLEKSLEAIDEALEKQRKLRGEGFSDLCSYDGPGFRRTARKLIREFERMPGLVKNYRKRADDLARGLEESRRKYLEKSEACSGQVRALLENEIREYSAYVDEDGARRREVEALEDLSREQIRLVQSTVSEALEVERIIDEWEYDDEYDEGPDLPALWSPVENHFAELSIGNLTFEHGVKDKEKEGWLEQVESMYKDGFLELVLPEGATVSEKRAELADAPTQTEMLSDTGRSIGSLDHLLVDEYCGEFFRNFCQAEGGVAARSAPEETALDYEAEYLVSGAKTDKESLSGAVKQLLAVREGLNLIHILSDPKKRAEAKTIAMAITGAASVTPLLMVTTFFVMSVWALGEALMDVRGLLSGRKVALVKSAGDWCLEADKLLSMGQSRLVTAGGGERGLSYLSWLKILMFMGNIVTQEYRMMDLIQMNLRLRQPGFRMKRGVYRAGITGEVCGKHVFFSLGFVENSVGGGDHTYQMRVQAERSY